MARYKFRKGKRPVGLKKFYARRKQKYKYMRRIGLSEVKLDGKLYYVPQKLAKQVRRYGVKFGARGRFRVPYKPKAPSYAILD